jgi:hypothetical protein
VGGGSVTALSNHDRGAAGNGFCGVRQKEGNNTASPIARLRRGECRKLLFGLHHHLVSGESKSETPFLLLRAEERKAGD